MSRKIKHIRRPKRRMLVLCEGLTEKLYLLSIKNTLPRAAQRGIKIEIECYKKQDPKNLVKEAVRRKHKAKYEGVPYNDLWIVFDHDNLPNRDFAFKESERENIKVAFNNISIELWFIIHFENSQKQFINGKQAKEYLSKNYIKEYEPGKTKIWTFLDSNKRNIAFQNAVAIRNAKEKELKDGKKKCNLNPYTTIDILVKKLLEIQ